MRKNPTLVIGQEKGEAEMRRPLWFASLTHCTIPYKNGNRENFKRPWSNWHLYERLVIVSYEYLSPEPYIDPSPLAFYEGWFWPNILPPIVTTGGSLCVEIFRSSKQLFYVQGRLSPRPSFFGLYRKWLVKGPSARVIGLIDSFYEWFSDNGRHRTGFYFTIKKFISRNNGFEDMAFEFGL